MATITATKAQTGVQPKGLRVGLVAVATTYSLAASLSVGDVIQMIKVPANATPVYVAVSSGSGACVVGVGDGISVSRYINILSDSVATLLTPINQAFVPYTYSTDDTIDITVSLVSTGVATGGFNMIAIFSMDT